MTESVGLRYASGKPEYHMLSFDALELMVRGLPDAPTMIALSAWWCRRPGCPPLPGVLVSLGDRWGNAMQVNYDLPARGDLVPAWVTELLTGPGASSGCRAMHAGLARLYGAGARKYGERNWELGMAFSRVFNPACRHALKSAVVDCDYETECDHMLHIAWQIVALETFSRDAALVAKYDDRVAA
jgi:hypothetical protein